jgi:hypothetical protein
MKLISKICQTVTTETFEIELTAGNSVIMIDYLDDRGKVIDTVLQDERGVEINDDELEEAIVKFLEELED